MSTPSIDDLRDLDDNDVKLLYDIVTAAEASSSPPFRALFTSYEQILAKRGISKDHDQVYLRFLLRMGELRKDGNGLFEQFELLLSKLGFQVEFDGDERVAHEWDQISHSGEDASAPEINVLQTQAFRPSRRASFDSTLDNQSDNKPLAALPARPRSTDGLPRSTTEHNETDPRARQAPPNSNITDRKWVMNVEDNSKIAPRASHQTGDLDVQSESQDGDESVIDSENISVYSGSEISHEARSPNPVLRKSSQSDGRNAIIPVPEHLDSKKHQLEANAKTLKYHHIAARAVLLFRAWSASARQARMKHDEMLHTATQHDTRILRLQSLDQWQVVHRNKLQARDTEQFFDNLEKQAGKAYNLFLMTKALSHWAQCASEEVQRRSSARRLVLQVRYFNAWRDITVVNELKARRLCLSKFFSNWMKRTDQVLTNEDLAEEWNSTRSISVAYRQWFWSFCERRTPAWYMTKSKERLFKKWLALTREATIRYQWAIDFRALELSRRCTSHWTRRSDVVEQHCNTAAIFRRRGLLGTTVDTLQKELQLAPRYTKIFHGVDLRVVRAAFKIWTRKVRDVWHGSRTSDLRTMRNVWTKWNDLLRCQALSRIIEDRISQQCLYKWILAERLAICEKAKAEGVKHTALAHWRAKMNDVSTSLSQAQRRFSKFQQRSQVSSVLRVWSSQAQAERSEEIRTANYCNRGLILRALTGWISRTQHLNQLDKWACDARFFMVASKSIKTWRQSAISRKKDRRREAFTLFRQKTKAAMAKKLLYIWQHSANAKTELTTRGNVRYQQRLRDVSTILLEDWRKRLSNCEFLDEQADLYCQEHRLQQVLKTWVTHLRNIHDSEVQADLFCRRLLDTMASASLRKLNWKAFQLRQQHESSESLIQRNQKKHHRQILRYLATVSAQKQQQRLLTAEENKPILPEADPPQSTFARRRSPWVSVSSRRVEAQSTSRLENFGRPHGLISTPSYMRTPSRRSVRAQAISQRQLRTRAVDPDTAVLPTPAVSRITPFMSRIRAQYTNKNFGSSVISGQGDVVEQTEGKRDGTFGFEDIPESPPLDI